MKTDALIYRFFQELPECFFTLLGRPETDAARYRFESIELKDTAARLDGLYTPDPPDEREPVYFLEFQNYRSERVYSNLILKIGLYLEKVNPRQNWHVVAMYPKRSLEQDNLYPYRGFLQSEQVTRVYLNEMPDEPSGPVGLGILRLIASKPNEALAQAQHLIPQVRSEAAGEKQRNLIELIATVIAYQFPRMSREEIEKMLQVNSFRETRVYQEAFEEGIEKGREEGEAEATEKLARNLIAKKYAIEEIAELTGLPVARIKKLKKRS